MSFNQLPLEILLAIFYFLDVPDIIRIRRVSWYLNHVSHHRDVWADAYRKAEFIRPPGPFLSQTTHDLENALVPSYRLDRCLRHRSDTAQGKQSIPKIREIRFTDRVLHVGLVFGRFLLVAFRDQIRCYDSNLDAFGYNSDVGVIYQPTGKYLKSFHCVSAFDIEGRRFACLVLTEVEDGMRRQISIYSLQVDEQSKVTLDLLHRSEHSEFDICSVDLGPRVIVIQGSLGKSPHDWHAIVFDVHACTQFLLAPPSGGLGADDIPDCAPGISTSTHLLLARPFHTPAGGWNTAVLAFALPPPDACARSIPLSPSHRGTVAGSVRRLVLLHDVTHDPSAEDILITADCVHFTPVRACSIFTGFATFCLTKSHHDEVGTITLQLIHSLDHHFRIRALHPTFNGTGRMFYMRSPGLYGTLAALEYDVREDDGSNGEPLAKTVDHTILRFPAPRSILDYDPFSGRICFRFDGLKDRVVEIMDLV